MDNKTYLDQIAVKGSNNRSSSTKKPLISPTLLKLILVGLIVIATLLGILSAIKKSNKADYGVYETLYLRAQNLSSSTSPIATASINVHSSDVRKQSTKLAAAITKLNTGLTGYIANEGADLTSISESVITSEATINTSYTSAINEAVLAGTLDRVYVAQTHYQITLLQSAIKNAKEKTAHDDFRQHLQNVEAELDPIENQFALFMTIY